MKSFYQNTYYLSSVKCPVHLDSCVLLQNKKMQLGSGTNFNYLIEGENLHALQCIGSKVDVIYIDPPYNKGKRLPYKDSFTSGNRTDSHSAWLNFMNERLALASQLLKDEGVIFISIGEDELARLTLLCDEVFGEANRIAILTIESNPTGTKLSKFISKSCEYCLVYAKDITKTAEFRHVLPVKVDRADVDSASGRVINKASRLKVVGSLKADTSDKDYMYSVYYDGEQIKIVEGEDLDSANKELIDAGFKRYTSSRGDTMISNVYKASVLQEYFDNGLLEFEDEDIYLLRKHPEYGQLKSLLKCETYDTVIDGKIVKCTNDYSNQAANIQLRKQIGNKNLKIYPKNVSLIKKLIGLYAGKDALVLDFFAGSGTTGQAVIALNAEDGENRRFILVNNNEAGIARDIMYPRIKYLYRQYNKSFSVKYFKTSTNTSAKSAISKIY